MVQVGESGSAGAGEGVLIAIGNVLTYMGVKIF